MALSCKFGNFPWVSNAQCWHLEKDCAQNPKPPAFNFLAFSRSPINSQYRSVLRKDDFQTVSQMNYLKRHFRVKNAFGTWDRAARQFHGPNFYRMCSYLNLSLSPRTYVELKNRRNAPPQKITSRLQLLQTLSLANLFMWDPINKVDRVPSKPTQWRLTTMKNRLFVGAKYVRLDFFSSSEIYCHLIASSKSIS